MLNSHNLTDFFGIPQKENSACMINENPYNFVSWDSDRLLVTVGDSWSWGYDLPDRLTSVFGYILSQRIGSDYLNLASPGCGNYFMCCRIHDLSCIITKLKYKKITVICTFTEVAREFNGPYDRKIDYFEWAKKNLDFGYDDLLSFINQQINDKIKIVVDNHKSVDFIFNTNFVDPIGFDDLNMLSTPWLKLYADSIALAYSLPCYFVSSWILDKIETFHEIYPDYDKKKIFNMGS